MVNKKYIGSSFDDFLQENLSQEEQVAIDSRANFELELIQCRKDSKLTQKDLSKKTGITQGTIAKIECGTTNPTLNNLFKILNAMGKTIKIVDLPK